MRTPIPESWMEKKIYLLFSFSLWEEHRLKTSGNKILMRIFGPKKEKGTEN
jgi:hypothetical protein